MRAMFRLFLIAAAAAWATAQAGELTVSSTQGEVEIYGSSQALVIGQSHYQFWTPLETVPQETEALRSALTQQGFDKVDVVSDLKGAELGKRIRAFLYQEVPRNTRLLLFVAAHGHTDQRYTGFLVPIDNPQPGEKYFLDNLVSLEDVSNWSKQSPAKHVMMVFDSCFSGAVFLTRSNLKPGELFLSNADKAVRQFISSGSASDQVPSRSDFVVKFIEGIGGGADTYRDGIVTGNELGYWLKAEITRLGKQTPQYGSSTLREFQQGDVLFKPSGAQPPAPIRYDSPQSGGTRGAQAQLLGEPDRPEMAMFRGIDVTYYQKIADGSAIHEALSKGGIPYRKTRAQLPESLHTNAIACGPDTPIEAIRALAASLVDSGIVLQAIIPFRQYKSKPLRLEVLTTTWNRGPGLRVWNQTGISREQIAALKACPAA
ncbi:MULTISPECIES: caspase family protein [Lysobacter]|uniref:caspase family protein n=1 Tax=Lysobacter TaxID=68 RepID=UPI001F3E82D7|nr:MULTISPECIES: caspase family protein [Lysobacter]UJB18877.1 caspase family protein [Lysobacter capsici]UJQ27398.1 caspase family protein [Lysobacter gummosus]